MKDLATVIISYGLVYEVSSQKGRAIYGGTNLIDPYRYMPSLVKSTYFCGYCF